MKNEIAPLKVEERRKAVGMEEHIAEATLWQVRGAEIVHSFPAVEHEVQGTPVVGPLEKHFDQKLLGSQKQIYLLIPNSPLQDWK